MSNSSNNLTRPPIVTIMGHIDHGKTTLLDKIRSTHVTQKEAGGITQHMGAYQVFVKQKQGEDKLITFIDTPGHAAFSQMRARGSLITDLVILVVAASEGIMPQTKESIEHIKKANLPFIVAMNKIDLETAQPDKIKGQLVELGFTPEEYGGQTAVIPVSAKTGQGIDDLLEMILLNAEILELKADPAAPFEAVVIESKLDKLRGPVTSVIVRQGTLKLGDQIYCEDAVGKVKALVDHNGKNINEAGPSTPVEILGFTQVPSVGSSVTPVKSEIIVPTLSPVNVSNFTSPEEEVPKLKIIVKSDVQGTLEAIKNSFSDDVVVISSGAGSVTDNDVFMAEAAKAQIFAFNVPVHKSIDKLAENSKVKIFKSRIIYEIIEEVQTQVLKMLEPTIDENVLGEGFVKAEFKINKVRIAGIQCNLGELAKGDMVHLKRDGKIIKDTKIEHIQQGKSIVEKVKSGSDCGITFKPYIDFKVNDVIIAYNKI